MEREMLGRLFKYEDDMLFKKRKGGNKWTCCNELIPNTTGYIRIDINNKLMLLHRLVYLFHNPDWDIVFSHDNEIDHINGNPLDNKIQNLRIVNQSQNQQNKTHHKGRPIKGVYFCKRNNKWKASWRIDKKQKGKYFKTEEEALEHRAKMVELYYTHDPLKRKENK